MTAAKHPPAMTGILSFILIASLPFSSAGARRCHCDASAALPARCSESRTQTWQGPVGLKCNSNARWRSVLRALHHEPVFHKLVVLGTASPPRTAGKPEDACLRVLLWEY